MKHLSRIYLILIFGILYIPIITLILFSFNATNIVENGICGGNANEKNIKRGRSNIT